MWEALFKTAIESGLGIFALLFIALLVTTIALVKWVLNTNNEREKRYIKVISDQASALKDAYIIKEDVKDIKSLLLSGSVKK